MASEWPVRSLEDLADRGNGSIAIGPFGSRLKSDAYTLSGVALIRGTNLTDGKIFSGEFVYVSEETASGLGNANVKPGDLVFPHRGNIGSVGIVPNDGKKYALSSSLMKITLDRKLASPQFYYYFFRTEQGRHELLKNASQVGTPGIATPLTSLRACQVPVPPLLEQESIAGILSSIDDRIDLLKQTNATLESIAQAIFKSWFIDFDPLRTNVEGREPEGATSQTAAFFPSDFWETGLGSLPQGWKPASIYDVADVVYGAPFASSAFNSAGQGIPLIRIRDLSSGAPQIWTEEVHPKGRLIQAGDLLVGMDGEFLPRIWLGEPGWLNQRVCMFIPRPPVTALWLRQALVPHLEFFERSKVGTTVIHLGKGDIDQIRLVVPPAPVMTAFAKVADPLLHCIVLNASQARTLADLRDTLLPRLISGKLRIPEAQATVEEALT